MHDLFLKGWECEMQSMIEDALNWYEKAKESGDKCAIFHTNCMDRFGQHMPLNIKNIFDIQSFKLNEEEFGCLFSCYDGIDKIEIQSNLGNLYLVMGKQDLAEKCHILAAEKGYAPSMHALCLMYFDTEDYVAVNKWCKLALDTGYIRAYNTLGYIYDNGCGVDVDHKEAVRSYLIAANAGYPNAQYNLGISYENGKGVDKDNGIAYKWYKSAAKTGYPEALSTLGDWNYHGKSKNAGSNEGISQNYKKARKWYKLARDTDPISQCNLGVMYDSGLGVEKSYVKAYKYFIIAAEAGSKAAQYNLGLYHEEAKGCVKDLTEAFKWYHLSAEAGFSSAQHKLGVLYENGIGVKQDYIEANMWYSIAACSGYTLSKYNLGKMYEEGKGCQIDYDQAYQLYKSAADDNHIPSQFKLGFFHAEGLGRVIDHKEAYKWFLLASEGGDYTATANLGVIHHKGVLGEKNWYLAHQYYNSAIKAGFGDAQSLLNEINRLQDRIESSLQTYILSDHHTRPSYLFFCNFLKYLIEQLSITEWHDKLLRDWVSKTLLNYFKKLDPTFSESTICNWYMELYCEDF